MFFLRESNSQELVSINDFRGLVNMNLLTIADSFTDARLMKVKEAQNNHNRLF